MKRSRVLVAAAACCSGSSRIKQTPQAATCTRRDEAAGHALRLRAELEPIIISSGSDSCASGSSVHSAPFHLPFSSFTVSALSTALLPIVFLPLSLQAVSSAAHLRLRRSGALSDLYDSHTDDDATDGECITVTLSGKGCRGLLSITRRGHPAQTSQADENNSGQQFISVRNRVGIPLPFIVTQSGGCTVLPGNGFIPAYGSVTLVAGDDGARARGCGASICVVHELLERSFKSMLLV